MARKIYFYAVFGFSLINFWYQYWIIGISGTPLSYLHFLASLILLLALFSYIFHKKLFEARIWKILLYIALANLVITFLMNLNQGTVYTSLGIQELFISFMGFLILDAPAYFALYTLSQASFKKAKK